MSIEDLPGTPAQSPPQSLEKLNADKAAELAVLEALNLLPGVTMRPATPEEDSGRKAIVEDKAVDVVGILNGKTAIAIQVTISTNDEVQKKKVGRLIKEPFVKNLVGMKAADTAVPRVLVLVDPNLAGEFAVDPDHDILKHPELQKQIVKAVIQNLRVFSLKQTKAEKEIKLIQELLGILEKFPLQNSAPPTR